jgi:hypothetical protein
LPAPHHLGRAAGVTSERAGILLRFRQSALVKDGVLAHASIGNSTAGEERSAMCRLMEPTFCSDVRTSIGFMPAEASGSALNAPTTHQF